MATPGLPGPVDTPPIVAPHRLRRWFLFWPVVTYLAIRLATLAAVALVDLLTHKASGSGSLPPKVGSGSISAAQHGWPRHLPMVGTATWSAIPTASLFRCIRLAIRGLSAAEVALAVNLSGLVIRRGDRAHRGARGSRDARCATMPMSKRAPPAPHCASCSSPAHSCSALAYLRNCHQAVCPHRFIWLCCGRTG